MCADLKRLKRSLAPDTWMCSLDFSIFRCFADFKPHQTGRRRIYIWPNFQQSASEILINYQTLNSGLELKSSQWNRRLGSFWVLNCSQFLHFLICKPDIHTQSQLLTFTERSDDISKDQVQFFFHKVQEKTLRPGDTWTFQESAIFFSIYSHNPDLLYFHI